MGETGARSALGIFRATAPPPATTMTPIFEIAMPTNSSTPWVERHRTLLGGGRRLRRIGRVQRGSSRSGQRGRVRAYLVVSLFGRGPRTSRGPKGGVLTSRSACRYIRRRDIITTPPPPKALEVGLMATTKGKHQRNREQTREWQRDEWAAKGRSAGNWPVGWSRAEWKRA
eukprot:gene16421-biopygen18794